MEFCGEEDRLPLCGGVRPGRGGGVAQDRITRREKMLGLQKRMEKRTRNNKGEGRVCDILYTMTQFILIRKTSENREVLASTKEYFNCCSVVIEVYILCFSELRRT